MPALFQPLKIGVDMPGAGWCQGSGISSDRAGLLQEAVTLAAIRGNARPRGIRGANPSIGGRGDRAALSSFPGFRRRRAPS
jgi:hypothetical protein